VVEPVTAPPQPPRHPHNVIRDFLHVIQWRLLIRMVVIYYIFCNNRGMPDQKKYMIAGLMFLCYLLQVGFLAYLILKLRNAIVSEAHKVKHISIP
jgi:membrane-bound metal-dependent hydrolase YbcI (DUF457 family)